MLIPVAPDFRRNHAPKKPTRAAPVPPPPPVGPVVLSVVRSDEATCVWTFSEAVLGINDVRGLRTAVGGEGLSYDQFEADEVTVFYGADAPVGTAWQALPGDVEMTFASGHALLPGSGTIG